MPRSPISNRLKTFPNTKVEGAHKSAYLRQVK